MKIKRKWAYCLPLGGSTLGFPPTVEAWARQRGLYPDQTQVVVQTLSSRHWLSAIEGKAGATKTTTLGAMRDIVTAHGQTVRGFGPTTGSMRALQEAGVKAKTVASLLAQRGEPSSDKGAVWLVDESSLLATRQVHTLLHRAREAQVARVIFVGDQRQHGAVEAGRPIAHLQAATGPALRKARTLPFPMVPAALQ